MSSPYLCVGVCVRDGRAEPPHDIKRHKRFSIKFVASLFTIIQAIRFRFAFMPHNERFRIPFGGARTHGRAQSSMKHTKSYRITSGEKSSTETHVRTVARHANRFRRRRANRRTEKVFICAARGSARNQEQTLIRLEHFVCRRSDCLSVGECARGSA